MAGLARNLSAASDLDTVWDRVVQASVSQVEGAEHAGITVMSRQTVSTPASTSELVRIVDEHQYTTGEGPCLTAASAHQAVVRVGDLSVDPRWPEFAAAAVRLGVRSMLSLQLYTDAESIGALNLYAASPEAFTDESVHTATLLAAHAAVAAVAAAAHGNLRIALDSRDLIGQAKGILMERYKLASQQAFDLLITASQATNRKLRDVAAELAESGVLGSDEPAGRPDATVSEW